MAGTITVNGKEVPLNGERNLLEVVRKAGVDLPTFCYHSELSVYGACRMCLVEEEKMGLVATCSTPPADGMKIKTNTARVQSIRKMVLELLLANHHRDCTTCERSAKCKLQELANRMGVRNVRFGEKDVLEPLDDSGYSIVRDPNKCILCGDCVRMCQEVQGLGVLTFAGRGSKVRVRPAFGKKIADVDCVNCGQCVAVCPTGALTVKSELPAVWRAIQDPTKTVIVQIAPAVRVALGEEFGLQPGEATTGKLAAALRMAGVDRVFDTCFTADLTIVEEATEFLNRVATGGPLPLFTSCCPGWVAYAERYCPDLLENLSTCRSPQQMFGSLAKKHYAPQIGVAPENLYVVSIMPCTAKKFEARRPEFAVEGVPDIDAVLTTQEAATLLRQAGINFEELPVEGLDMPFGFVSGAAEIFGASGGVAEAALRMAVETLEKKTLEQVEFKAVRGMQGTKEAALQVAGLEVKVAVTNGLANARKLIERVRKGEATYHLIEVMACPGGCVGGGGQPYPNDMERRAKRSKGLYGLDRANPLKKSQDNPTIKALYAEWLGKPGGHEAHEALHTHYGSRRRIKGTEIAQAGKNGHLEVSVCIGTSCFARGSYDLLQALVAEAEKAGVSDRLNFRATFCMENCAHGPSVTVGGSKVKGIKPADAKAFFAKNIMPLVKG